MPQQEGPARACLRVALVAQLTFLQSWRSRWLSSALLVAAACVAAGLAAANATLFAHARLVIDLGLAAMSLAGAAVAIAQSLVWMTGDGQQAAQWMLLTKPISRSELFVGRYFGVVATAALFASVVGLGVAGGVVATGTPVPASLGWAWAACLGELAVTTAVAFLFANTSTRALAATLSGAVWMAGQFSDELLALSARHPHEAMGVLAAIGHAALPDYARLHLRDFAAAQMAVPGGVAASTLGYAASYAAAALCLGALAYARPPEA